MNYYQIDHEITRDYETIHHSSHFVQANRKPTEAECRERLDLYVPEEQVDDDDIDIRLASTPPVWSLT